MVSVPVGTQLSIAGLIEPVVVDLLAPGDSVAVAMGGEGGRGNRSFSTPEVQVPRLAESGALGECRDVVFNYKMLSDIVVLGPPNSGKSSLLNRVASVEVRVADHPMTTVEPVRVMFEKSWIQYSMAEVPSVWFPGVVSGGKGVKLHVLKHVERAFVLVVCLDSTSQTLEQDYVCVVEGLNRYSHGLPEKPRIILLNKVDYPSDRKELLAIKRELEKDGVPTYFISAKTGEGVEEALSNATSVADRVKAEYPQPKNPPHIEIRPQPKHSEIEVTRVGKGFILKSEHVERVIKGTNLSEWEARVQLMSYMRRSGVNKALEKASAEKGDSVRIGDMEFELQ